MALTPEQLHSFVQDGVLVVENILNEEELQSAVAGLHKTLNSHGVDPDRLEDTGQLLRHLSSTNGSGGVLDLFYDEWKIKIVATNSKLFAATAQLWEEAYCHNNETKEEVPINDRFQWHPYGAFDCTKGYMYIDRIGYRLPTVLAETLGAKVAALSTHHGEISPEGNTTNSKFPRSSKGKNKNLPLQRSLTPHLDCCPQTMFSNDSSKWRPIQCFVALTDALERNTGGFEAARRFHREFEDWKSHRPCSVKIIRPPRPNKHGPVPATESLIRVEIPAPCLGEYTHIRPAEDKDVLQRIQHIAVPAGSAVFWDNRIPHANSFRHDGDIPRAVVYCSFLPDVPINRRYCSKQLENWTTGRNPTDQWINPQILTESGGSIENHELHVREQEVNRIRDILSTPLARCLAGLDSWT